MAMIRPRKGAHGARRWQWRVARKGYSPIHGTCPTKECAKDCAAKAEADLLAGRIRGLTVRELLDRFERARLPEIPDSAGMYRRHLDWWQTELGDADAQVIQPARIALARERLRAEPGRGGRLRSPASINRYLNTLSSAFRWGRLPHVALVDRNPVRDVPRDPERPRVRYLSRPTDGADSELERLLAALSGSTSPTLADLIVLLLWTGCRIGEILSLRVDWVRLAERGFSIPAEIAKTEEPRFVSLEGPALEIVRRRVESARFRRGQFLFPGKRAGRRATFPRDAWERLLRRARITNLRPHDLRHTAASYLVMAGKSIPEVGQQLGHKSAQSTARYAHLSAGHGRQTSRDLSDLLSGWLMPRSADES